MAKGKVARLKSIVAEKIFQLHVSLPDTKPLVWRRILVPANFSLEALHSIIQLTMGWQMTHLYDFHIGKKRFAHPDEFDRSPVGEIETSLSKSIGAEKSFTYNYDFGDDWRHKIKVEDILNKTDSINYPICIGGENACPPEDCGAFFGYENLKNIISDPSHPEYSGMIKWLGGFFDPKSFDPNRINRDMLWVTDWENGSDENGLYRPFNMEPLENYL